jgi:peptidoglycan/xylan/chitin deacetylase (PgdA/CDA1 family)
MKIPVLAYHSHWILGNTYQTNDHIALSSDLRTVHAQGFLVVPLVWIVEWLLGRREDVTLRKCVALTFDDGADFDYYDIDHPQHGPQRSFYNILSDFQKEFGVAAQPFLHASSFVIVSPEVRRAIDQRSYAGLNWMTDGWWKEAQDSGLLSIYNHSWDHNHPDADSVYEKSQCKGSFFTIDTFAECEGEIKRAAEYIHQKVAPVWPELFAYPWGQSSRYLRETYFPGFADRHRTIAAFAGGGGYVTKTSPRWNLPRFGSAAPWPEGWNSTEQLVEILQGAL